MKINDLSYNAEGSRYGYNSQEQSTELNLDGNHTTAEFWEYDSRSARRWNLDTRPVKAISPYAIFQGNPIMFSDMKGDSVLFYSSNGQRLGYSNDNERYKDQNFIVVINADKVENFQTQLTKKINATIPEERVNNGTGDEYREALVAGLLEMGTAFQYDGSIKDFTSLTKVDKGDNVISYSSQEGLLIPKLISAVKDISIQKDIISTEIKNIKNAIYEKVVKNQYNDEADGGIDGWGPNSFAISNAIETNLKIEGYNTKIDNAKRNINDINKKYKVSTPKDSYKSSNSQLPKATSCIPK